MIEDSEYCGVFNITTNNIFVIGDIHGDYQCLIHCLVDLCQVATITHLYDDDEYNEKQREYLEWIPNNNSVVVFTGDLVDRKRYPNCILDDECSDIYIIKTLLRLKTKAKEYGGNIIIISGNHEIMNIVDINDNLYVSNKNIVKNKKYFSDPNNYKEYIDNSYAWVVINDILIAHGGLCSGYMNIIESEKHQLENDEQLENSLKTKYIHTQSNDKKFFIKNLLLSEKIKSLKGGALSKALAQQRCMVVNKINKLYRKFFMNKENFNITNSESIGYKLFVNYETRDKHNMFWCREWGYSGINCEDFTNIIEKIGCNKMIIGHCPQFFSSVEPKMINFDCGEIINSKQHFKIARVDVGMSRSFEYNIDDENFINSLSTNYNRKIEILKLLYDSTDDNYYFNTHSIITHKLSCLQYLLLKYGQTHKEWVRKNIHSDWVGFQYIEKVLDKSILTCDISSVDQCKNAILCLLYPICNSSLVINSIQQFNSKL